MTGQPTITMTRKPFSSAQEMCTLVDGVEKERLILSSTLRRSISNAVKTRGWEEVGEWVNAVGVGGVRTINDVPN